MGQSGSEQSTALEQLQSKAGEAKGQAGEQIRQQLDSRSSEAGEQIASMAGAIRRSAEQLREEGRQHPSRLLEQGADRVEQMAGYLQQVDADAMLRDVEQLGRRRPWAMAAGAAAIGFAASRFLRASSERRYGAGGVQGRQPGTSASGFEGGEATAYERVPSSGLATRTDGSPPEEWRGPDVDLSQQARRTTMGQQS
jgi:ElaB/YqjD/DUF883 family membrane-anchored ribosome-binding protein